MKTKFFLFAGMLSVLALTSCSEYLEDGTPSSPQSLKIEVSDANLDGKATTRAAYSGYTTTFESGDQIGLYVTKGSRVIVANACYTYDGSAWSTSSTVEYNSGYSYYAYYPYVASPYTPDFTQSTVDAKFDNFLTDASDKFHKADQSTKANYQASDLMIAQGADAGSNTVSFAMLHKKGLAVFDGEGAADATFTGNIPYLMSTTKYFLMKPSTSTSFTDDEGTYSLSASSGKYVTHNIAESYSTFTLSVTGPAAYTYAGGSNTYSVTSYKSNSAGTKHKAAAWTATYSTDGGSSFSSTKPSWLTTFTASGDGSTTATNYTATISAQSSSSGSGVTASSVLASAAEVSDYDLSLHTVAGADCSRTTANCYLVHAPGTYKLPLVYGNAIKNGSTNTTAFYPNVSSNALARFINHAGTGITDPWLKNNNATPTSANVVWSDVASLVTSPAISGDYLTFTVPAASIAEGNAVIAVKNSGGTIVWSWHIWVTPETFSNTTSVATGSHTYTVTPVNLGWVNTGNISWTGYDGRSCVIKISQAGGQERTFTITQSPSKTVTESKTGYQPYYQWGRKDPFTPNASNTGGNTDHSVSGTAWSYSQNNSATIGTNIQNPTVHYYNNSTYGPVSTTYYNMWDAQNTTTGNVTSATKKTIYDPCPPGFCVPTSNLWYFMSGNSGSSSSAGSWDNTNKGRLWTSNTPNIYFPASGYRNGSSGSLSSVGSGGYYWSASPYGSYNGHYLHFHSSYWYWNNVSRAYGFPVRPVAEE